MAETMPRTARPAPVVARSGGSTPHRLVLRKHRRAVSSCCAVGGSALALQLERVGIDLRRSLRVRRPRHQSLLSPVADAPRPDLPEMAGGPASQSLACATCRTRRRVGRRCIGVITSMPTLRTTHIARWLISSGGTSAGCWWRTATLRGWASMIGTRKTFCAIHSLSSIGAGGCIRSSSSHPGRSSFWSASRSDRSSGDGTGAAVRFGASLLIWRVVCAVAVWHITWLVNSAAHLWGYRNYETGEDSRNNWFVAILTSGEGWHNNHHADPRSARHGHRQYEVDLIFGFIRMLEAIGLAAEVSRPDPRLIARLSGETRRR